MGRGLLRRGMHWSPQGGQGQTRLHCTPLHPSQLQVHESACPLPTRMHARFRLTHSSQPHLLRTLAPLSHPPTHPAEMCDDAVSGWETAAAEDGTTPMAFAQAHGNAEIIRHLIAAKVAKAVSPHKSLMSHHQFFMSHLKSFMSHFKSLMSHHSHSALLGCVLWVGVAGARAAGWRRAGPAQHDVAALGSMAAVAAAQGQRGTCMHSTHTPLPASWLLTPARPPPPPRRPPPPTARPRAPLPWP